MELVWILLGIIVAAVIGVIAGWLIGRRRPEPEVEEVPDEPVTREVSVPDVLYRALELSRMPYIVVGPADEVLASGVQTRMWGLARSSRVADLDVLEAVRQARRDKGMRSLDVERQQGIGGAPSILHVRVDVMNDDLTLVLVEDRSAARRVDQTRRDFVANISHELKTPIGAIQLLTEALHEAADEPEAIRRFAGRMSKESSRLSELVTQIIDLSRLQSDDPLVQAEVVSMTSVIEDAASRHREAAERRHVMLSLTTDDSCLVFGDEAQLADAVANLLHNALSYSHEGARVAVVARQVCDDDERTVEISVSDNGIGISQENLTRIFERFYRVDYARSRESGGTGLGLSIVKHIVAMHGGSVDVWSQPGHGSTFTLRLPALGPEDLESTVVTDQKET